ncbi:hypothetical protein [Nostoc sp.]
MSRKSCRLTGNSLIMQPLQRQGCLGACGLDDRPITITTPHSQLLA